MEKELLLIVDDSKSLRTKIKKMIENILNEMEIQEAENLQEAIELINERYPDILIIDLSLPDGSGFEILEKFQNNLKYSLKIILTNYPYEKFRERADELGADFFFDKSIDQDKMINAIDDFIRNKKGQLKMNPRTKTILVVDDSSTMRKMVIASLKSIDGSVFIEAENGLEAIEKLSLSKIDAVILDLNMPDVQGFEVLQFIKSHELYKDVKVIVLTTRSDDESKEEALRIGADIYMTKPFLPDELLKKFQSLLEGESK